MQVALVDGKNVTGMLAEPPEEIAEHPRDQWPDITWPDGMRRLPVIDQPAPFGFNQALQRAVRSNPVLSEDGRSVVYGWDVIDRYETAEELDAYIARRASEIIDQVNREAGEQRSRYITVTVGQDATYSEKEAEAARYLADPAPNPADYVYLPAEAKETGQTLREVAELVKATADTWRQVNARIEAKRRGVAVKAAAAVQARDIAALNAVLPVDWSA